MHPPLRPTATCRSGPRARGSAPVAPLLAALALVLASGDTRARGEEPTDPPIASCADAADIGRIPLPHEIDGSLEGDDPSARVDFYRLEAEPRLALRVDMTDQRSEPSTMRNPLLGLFDADCNRLAYNDDLSEPGIRSLDARLTFPVPDGGVFVLAAAASPDTGFDGSSDDTGTYTLRIDRTAPLPPFPAVVEPPLARIERAADGRIDVSFEELRPASGYDVYRDGRYLRTLRPSPGAWRFRLDGAAGAYCLVAFVESGDLVRHSRCSEPIAVGADGLVAGPPSAPRELRAMIYSPGVVELLWRPGVDDGRIVAYRIRRDGVEIETADRQSRVERGLEPRRLYRYSVTAIDDEGLEGAPAYLDVRPVTKGEVPPSGGNGAAPAPPGALRGTLYSAGTAEIFWARSTDHAALAGYEVSRDGVRVAFHRGASHFEPRLPARASHLWSVVAIGVDGARSAPRRLRLDGETFTAFDDAPSEALITRESHVELLAHAFELYVGTPYGPSMQRIAYEGESLADIRVSRDTSANPILDVYDCGDGRAELALLWSGTNYGEVYDWTFEHCLHDGLLHDGALNLHSFSLGPALSSAGFSARRASGLGLGFSGTVRWWFSQSRGSDRIRSWDTEAFSLDARTIDGDLALEDSTTRFAYGYRANGRFDASLEGHFAVRSDTTGGALVHASTPLAFSYVREPGGPDDPGEAWTFTSGLLELVAEDGSRVQLDADTGDPATARITIDNERGTDTFVADWAPWRSRLRFTRDPLGVPERVDPPTARPDAAAGPAITPENHVALLDHVLGLYAGAGYAEALAIARRLVSGEGASATATERGIRTDRIDCDGGGSATLRRVDEEATTALPYRVRFDACESAGYRLDGEARGETAPAAGGAWELESDALSWLDGGGTETLFRGRVALGRTVEPSGAPGETCTWRTEGMSVSGLAGDAEAVVVTSAGRDYLIARESGLELVLLDAPPGTRLERRDDGLGLSLHGGLDIVSAPSGGHALRVVAAALTTRTGDGGTRADGGFVSGGLFVQAEDGSRLYLGDFVESSEANIVIANAEGRHEITTPWIPARSAVDDAYEALCSSPP